MISTDFVDLIAFIVPISIFVITFGILGIVIYSVHVANKRRIAAMKELSFEIGFTHKEAMAVNLVRPLFDLMNNGHSRKVTNMLEGKHRHLKTEIFDYTYTVGYGKNQSTFSQTVIIKKIPDAYFPRFLLKKEGFWHKVGNFFGYKDIDFEGFKMFSDKYFLKGKDEKNIRKLFSPKLLKHFEYNETKYIIEAAEGSLLFYRLGKKLKPQEIYQEMDKCASIASLFQERISAINNSSNDEIDEQDSDGHYVVKNGKINFHDNVKSSDTFTAQKNLGTQPVSGLAVGALLMAFLMPIIGLIIAVIALSKFSKNGSSSAEKNMTIAALVISIIQMVFWTFTLFINFAKFL